MGQLDRLYSRKSAFAKSMAASIRIEKSALPSAVGFVISVLLASDGEGEERVCSDDKI